MALLRRGDPRERDDTLNPLQYGSRLPFEVMQAAGGFPRRGLLHTNGNAGSGYSRKKPPKPRFSRNGGNWWPETLQPCWGQAALTPLMG